MHALHYAGHVDVHMLQNAALFLLPDKCIVSTLSSLRVSAAETKRVRR